MMGIERNCPIEVIYAPTFQLFKESIEELATTEVVELKQLEILFEGLSKECKSWKKSDGQIWWDSPEAWLRKQLDLPRKDYDMNGKMKKWK